MVAANQNRRYFEIEYHNILRRVGKLSEKDAEKALEKARNPVTDAISNSSSDQLLALYLDAAKPPHLKFYEESLNAVQQGPIPTIGYLSPAAAKGLWRSLAKGKLPSRVSSPLFKYLPFIKATARSGD